MDGQRFDELARLVANGVPRRRVLGMFAGGVAAVFARGHGANAGTCGNEGDPCDDASNLCCGGLVCDVGGTNLCVPLVTCTPEGEACGVATQGLPIDECCAGLICDQGVCSQQEPICADAGEACSQLAGQVGCCEGFVCVDGFCALPKPVCAELDSFCGGKAAVECCDGLECIEGSCQEPASTCIEQGGSCSGAAGAEGECCDGLTCIDGLCNPPADCRPEGEECEGDIDCCTGICCAGFCRDIECCIDEPSPNDRCDDGETCNEGICEGVAEICESDDDCAGEACCCDDGGCDADCCADRVTQLPDTGVGRSGKASTGLFAAAAGAAAALLAGKKLREAAPEAEPKS